LSDEEVVARVLAGDVASFEILMRRHNQRLYRAARAVLRDDVEAEDVTQHAYLEAYAHLDRFEGRARFSTWLTRIALHEAFARARRRSRLEPFDESCETAEVAMAKETSRPDPEREAYSGELRVLLEAAIDALPTSYRAVFVLRELEEFTTAEAAECLELSQEVVKTRLHRAKAMLREELLQRAGAAGAVAFSFHLSRCDKVVRGVLQALEASTSRPTA
jgi:RNA polymerase sigma-70 factor (ECF subfamily)